MRLLITQLQANPFEAFDNNPAFLVAFLTIVIVLLLAIVLIGLLFCLTLSKTLNFVAPHLRTTSPNSVWRIWIPFYNIVWQFILVRHMADSIAAEYRRRALPLSEDRPAYNIGLWANILGLCSLIPFLGSFASLISTVLRIVYWVKIAGYKSELQRSGPWENFTHLDAMSQNQQAYTSAQNNWSQPTPNWQTPPPANPTTPPPTQQSDDPNDHSRWAPPKQ
jgi:hypothetical protein